MIVSLEEVEDKKENTRDSSDNLLEFNKIKQLLELKDIEYISPIIKSALNIQDSDSKRKTEYIVNSEGVIFAYKVILYLRLSEEDEDLTDGDVSKSIRNQLLLLLDECVNKRWKVVGIFCEDGISGADDNRPEWKKSLNFCKQKRTDIYICKSQSRFSRSMEMIEKYLHKEFIDWGIRFVGVVDKADTSNKANKRGRQILGYANEWFLEEISENIRKVIRNKKENGLFFSSNPPYRLFERYK